MKKQIIAILLISIFLTSCFKIVSTKKYNETINKTALEHTISALGLQEERYYGRRKSRFNKLDEVYKIRYIDLVQSPLEYSTIINSFDVFECPGQYSGYKFFLDCVKQLVNDYKNEHNKNISSDTIVYQAPYRLVLGLKMSDTSENKIFDIGYIYSIIRNYGNTFYITTEKSSNKKLTNFKGNNNVYYNYINGSERYLLYVPAIKELDQECYYWRCCYYAYNQTSDNYTESFDVINNYPLFYSTMDKNGDFTKPINNTPNTDEEIFLQKIMNDYFFGRISYDSTRQLLLKTEKYKNGIRERLFW